MKVDAVLSHFNIQLIIIPTFAGNNFNLLRVFDGIIISTHLRSKMIN